MEDWYRMKQRIINMREMSPAARSSKRSLLKIIRKAEEWGLSPEAAELASNSNLLEIIRQAKEAIDVEDTEHLEKLFKLASRLTTTDLRNCLRARPRDNVLVQVEGVEDAERYVLELTEAQLTRISKATKRNLNFKVAGVDTND